MRRGLASLLLLAAAGCSPAAPSDLAARAPEGPCWAVNLADGLGDEGDELHQLFACVNRTGTFAPLDGVDIALASAGRSGNSGAADASAILNHLLETRFRPATLLDGLRAFFDRDPDVEPWSQIAVELIYAQPYPAVTALPTAELAAPAGLEAGVLSPLLDALPPLAGALLDEDPLLAGDLLGLWESGSARDLRCTLAGLAATADPSVQALAARLLPDLGDLIQRSANRSNDRWSAASGSSLRDLIVAVAVPDEGGPSYLSAVAPDLHALLADPSLAPLLEGALAQTLREGTLDDLFAGLAYLGRIDATGAPLRTDGDSALTVLLRLLSEADHDIDCLGIRGNLAILLLGVIADLDPDLVDSGLSLLGDLFGYDSYGVLTGLLQTVCPDDFDDPLLDDLDALFRLQDPEAGDLLLALIPLVRALADAEGDDGRLPELVALLAAAHRHELGPPLGELLQDADGAPLLADLVEAVPLVLEPDALHVDTCPVQSAPLDLPATLHLLDATLAAPDALLPRIEPLMVVAAEDDALWTAVDHTGALLVQPAATTAGLLPLLTAAEPAPLNPAPGLLADLLGDPLVVEPSLRLVENRTLIDSLRATDPAAIGPLPWAALLVRDGILNQALATVDLILELLDAASAAPSETP